MNRGERSATTGILIAGAFVLALLAGVAIPWASGSAPGQRTVSWMPPPSITPSRTPSVAPTPARTHTSTAEPTAAPSSATPTRLPTTSPPAPAVTDLPAQAAPTPTQRGPGSPPTAPAASETPEGAPAATVRQGPLAIRTQPNTTAGAIALARAGDTFTVTGRSADGLWLKVCCVRDTPGWLAAEFVAVAGSLPDVPAVVP